MTTNISLKILGENVRFCRHTFLRSTARQLLKANPHSANSLKIISIQVRSVTVGATRPTAKYTNKYKYIYIYIYIYIFTSFTKIVKLTN